MHTVTYILKNSRIAMDTPDEALAWRGHSFGVNYHVCHLVWDAYELYMSVIFLGEQNQLGWLKWTGSHS